MYRGLKIGQRDLAILSELRQNARQGCSRMSKKIRIPVSTIYDHIQYNKAVKRFTALLDFDRLGLHTRAQVMLKVEQSQKENLRAYLRSHPSVNSLLRVTNGFDFMVEVVVGQVTDVEAFLETIRERFEVRKELTCFVVEEIRREALLMDAPIYVSTLRN